MNKIDMNNTDRPTVLITGGSKGIGIELPPRAIAQTLFSFLSNGNTALGEAGL